MPTTTEDTWLELPGGTPIEGLRVRHPRGDDADYEAMASLMRAAGAADADPWSPTATTVREEMEGTATFDPIGDALVAEIDDAMVAQASVERVLREGKPTYDLRGFVRPEWRRRGIGRALLGANLRHAIELGEAASDPFPLTVRGFASEHELGHRALLESNGFSIVRWFFLMSRPNLDAIPDAALPAGLEVRPVRPEDHLAIFDAEYEAFRDHWQPHDYDLTEFETLYRKTDIDTDLWVVAWDGDAIAGVVQNWIWRDENAALGVRRGWLEHISVRRPWRRRGLARAITAESLRRLRAAGMTEAMLGVDAENPTGALGLYEGLGFEVAQRSSAYIRSLER
jgi:mycothiol synthase